MYRQKASLAASITASIYNIFVRARDAPMNKLLLQTVAA
jgi:hypothetical protein